MSLDVWRRYWTQFDWVEELLYLALLATEACVIYPWQRFVYALAGYQEMPFLGLCILLWVPYLIASLLDRTELTPDRKQATVVGLALLSALVAIRLQVYGGRPIWDIDWIAEMVDRLFSLFSRLPPELIPVALAFVGWWRGIVVSRREYDNQQTWYHFRVGVIVLLAYFMVTLFGHRADLSLLIFAYFFFGLLSIALVRIQELGGIHKSTMGSKQWVAVLVASTLVSLGLALLISLLFSREVLRAVLGGFRPLWQLLARFAWFVLSILFYLAWPLIEFLVTWVRQIAAQATFFGVSPLGSPLSNPLEVAEGREFVDPTPYCRTITVVVIVVGGLLLVAGAVRRIAQQRAEREELERESLLSSVNLADDLKNSLRQGWDRLVALADQFGGRRRRSAASIRRIYASMADLATEAGYPRRPAETPYEYLSTLYQAFAGGDAAVEAITEAYVRVHYGEAPGTRAEMDRIVRHWEQVQRLVSPRARQEER